MADQPQSPVRREQTKKDTEQNLHRQWRTGAQLSVSLSYTY